MLSCESRCGVAVDNGLVFRTSRMSLMTDELILNMDMTKRFKADK